MSARLRVPAASLCLALAALAAASAEFVEMETRRVPVQRLAENIERQLKAQPGNIELRLNLARLHAMAYSLKVTEFEARTTEGSNLEAWFGHTPRAIPGQVKEAPAREHLERAKADLARATSVYRDVIARAPRNFLAHLGLAWCLEQAGARTEAVAHYRKVVEIAFDVERKSTTFIMMGQEPATTEAAARLRVLLDPVQDANELATLQEQVQELDRRGRAITPIAIPLGDDLSPPLAADARVLFDADGSGIPRRWSWIDPDAGWLVYDADGSGEIQSALDWFGSVTFWLFWSNGYQALAALDDNSDGELRGAELRNLALWRDANVNGISEKGEVLPLASHGIVALSCTYERGDETSLVAQSRRGAILTDGTTRPTYDLILRAAKKY